MSLSDAFKKLSDYILSLSDAFKKLSDYILDSFDAFKKLSDYILDSFDAFKKLSDYILDSFDASDESKLWKTFLSSVSDKVSEKNLGSFSKAEKPTLAF